MAMSHMSHIVKTNVFMICIFIVLKLVYFTTVNLDLPFTYKRIFSQLNDLVYMSCGSKSEMNYVYRISPAIVFTMAVQICFCLPFLKYGLLLSFGHWQPAISSPA